MRWMSAVLLVVAALVCGAQDAFADHEDKSGELDEYQEGKNPSGESFGPPDSHEAMNNRPSAPNRIKRSYEFLIGLINNNSRYEVTNVDVPPLNQSRQGEEISDNAVSTGETLLELMVKIAAHPDQWEKVHKLLEKLDEDLEASRKLVESIKSATISNSSNIATDREKKQLKKAQKEENVDAAVAKTPSTFLSLRAANDNDNLRPQVEAGANGSASENLRKRPDATTQQQQGDEIQKMVVVLSGGPKKVGRNQTAIALKGNKWPQPSPPVRVAPPFVPTNTYPKSFAYHRVTGHPLPMANWDKKPKAYIAVSVIAPKPFPNRPPDDDFVLENELRQLKPWTHKQNLKNMASIRSRWVIESNGRKKETV